MAQQESQQESEPRGGRRKALPPALEARFEEGLRALDEHRVADAVQVLREAHAAAPDHAQLRSTLGLAVARDGGDFVEARGLCEEATRQEFFNPDLYLNLAKVYLIFDRRSEALRYLRRGHMLDPGHGEIGRSIASLGHRRLPILPFLPRRHPVNRALGTARTRLLGAFSRA